jgi:hypothetical protein
MNDLLVLFLTVAGAVRQPESDALRQTAPSDLGSREVAALHLAAATFAGERFSVDPELLLAIAYRESRYQVDVVGPPVNGQRACGLMQSMPRSETCQKQSVLEGYLEGASHLRTWLDTKTCRGDLRCALLGYAGGYALITKCKAGPVVIQRNKKRANLCTFVPRSTEARASMIRTRIARAAGAS